MATIKFDENSLAMMSLFSKITNTTVKDFFEEEGQITFIVSEGDAGRAIGKGAVNVRRLETITKRKIKIVEFCAQIPRFITNLIYPIRVKEVIETEDGIFTITASDIKSRGLLIGRAASNLRRLEEQVKRYHKIKEIKVV